MTEQEKMNAVDEVMFPTGRGKEERVRLLFPTGATDTDGQPIFEEREVSWRYRPMPIKWAKELNVKLEEIQARTAETLSDQLSGISDTYVEAFLLMARFYRLHGVSREVVEGSLEDVEVLRLVERQAEVQSRDSFLLKLLRMILMVASRTVEMTEKAQGQHLDSLEKQLLTSPFVKPGESATTNSSSDTPQGS